MAQTEIHKYTVQERLGKMDVDLITVAPDIAEATYSTGDLMAEGETIANAVAVNGGSCILQSITAIDTSDTGGTIYLVLSDTDGVDLGTVGSAINAADSVADNSVAIVELSNWTDVGGAKVCTKSNIGVVLQAIDTSMVIAFGLVN